MNNIKDSMKISFKIKLSNVGRSKAFEEFIVDCKDRDEAEYCALKHAKKYLISKGVELIENGEDDYLIISGCRPCGQINIEVNV